MVNHHKVVKNEPEELKKEMEEKNQVIVETNAI